jgi:peptidoglycan/LPS O-acetylase OafA/YrhL
LYSANLITFPLGHHADEGQYDACKSFPSMRFCMLSLSLKCVNTHKNVSYTYPNSLFCNGPFGDNGLGVCYNTTQCQNESSFQSQLDTWSNEISPLTKGVYFPTCYLLEVYERGWSNAQVLEFLDSCNYNNSYLMLESWCDAADPISDAERNSDSTLAIKYTLLVVLCFSALATLFGIIRRSHAGWREDFNNDDEVINVTLASQQGRRSQSKDKMSLLDRLLYGEAELSTSPQDAAQMEEASLNAAGRKSRNDEDFYVTQLTAGDPEKAFRRTIESGGFDTAYDDPRSSRYGNEKSCCSCDCDSDACWRSFSSSIVGIFDAFDVLSGLKEFFTPIHGNLPTAYLDGVRTCAMFLVVAGHVIFFPHTFGSFSNMNDLKAFFESYQSVTLFPAILAVDTFFWLSGFLSTYLLTRQFDKMKKGKTSIMKHKIPAVILAYINRYLRLTVTLAVVIAIAVWVLPTFVDGPLSRIITADPENVGCKPYFWAQITYFFGYDLQKYQCVPWIWYLSVDMVCFAFVPVVVAIDHTLREKNYTLRYVVPILTFLATAFGYGWAIYQHPMIGEFHEGNGQVIFTYGRAADRYTPFAIGALTAFVVNNFPSVVEFFEKSKTACWVSFIFALALAVGIWNFTWSTTKLTYTNPNDLTDALKYGMHSMYMLWGVPLSLTALPALGGYKNFFTRLLSHPFFTVLGKLTYGMYLVHPIVMGYAAAEGYRWVGFHRFQYYVSVGGVFSMSAFIALILFLLIDRPVGKFCTWLTGLFGVKKQKRFS